MFFGFGCMLRLAMLAALILLVGSAAMVGLIVASDNDFVDLPGISGDPQPGAINEVTEKRELFEEVPYISEVSTEPEVVGTNAGLAIFFAVVFGTLGAMLNNLVRAHEKDLEDWLEYFYIKRFFNMFKFAVGTEVRRGCLGMPIILLLFAVYGIIFTLLEPGTSPLEPEGMQLTIIMGTSVALVSLSGDFAQRQLATFWRRQSKFGVYPANLSIAMVTTLLSRLLGLSPGIMFGTPGGVDIDMDGETEFREVVMAGATVFTVVSFGLAGWLLTAFIRAQGDVELSGTTLEIFAPLAQFALGFGLALFVVATETAFFEMMPLSLTTGAQIFRWHPLAWGVIFLPVFFLASHTLFNPEGEYLQAFREAPVLILTGVAIILAAILVWFWVLFRYFEPPHITAQKRRAAYEQPPQPPQYPQ